MAFSSLVRPNAEAGQQVPFEPEPLARVSTPPHPWNRPSLTGGPTCRSCAQERRNTQEPRTAPSVIGVRALLYILILDGLSSLCSDRPPSHRRQHRGLPDYGRVDSLDLSDRPVPCGARRVGLCGPASDSAKYAGSLCSRRTSQTGTLGYCRPDRQREPRQAVKVCASTHTLPQNWYHNGSYQQA